jgi:hypothetical protein
VDDTPFFVTGVKLGGTSEQLWTGDPSKAMAYKDLFTTDKGRRKLTFLLRYLELTANNPSRKHAVRLDAMHEYLKSRKVRVVAAAVVHAPCSTVAAFVAGVYTVSGCRVLQGDIDGMRLVKSITMGKTKKGKKQPDKDMVRLMLTVFVC